MVTEAEKEYPKQPKEIVLEKGGTRAVVEPNGAMVTSFNVGDTEVFFPDQKVKLGNKEKRRGGNPILFPIAGPEVRTGEFNLNQHGFGRNMEWEIKGQGEEENSVSLRLTSNEETKKQYPYDFETDLSISVNEEGLRLDQSVTNHSSTPMPLAPGFHPYLRRKPEEGTPLMVIGQEQAKVLLSSGKVTIKSSPEFKKTVVWTDNDDYICVEPWVGDENAILDPDQRIEIQPRESVNLWMEIQFQKS